MLEAVHLVLPFTQSFGARVRQLWFEVLELTARFVNSGI